LVPPRKEVSVSALREQVTRFLGVFKDVLSVASATVGDYSLEDITVSAEVSATGRLSILGTGGEIGGNGGLSFTFKKRA
jgi:hypothetical protein